MNIRRNDYAHAAPIPPGKCIDMAYYGKGYPIGPFNQPDRLHDFDHREFCVRCNRRLSELGLDLGPLCEGARD